MPHFTHTRKWGIKYTSAVHVHTLSLLRNFRHQEGSWTVAHPIRVQAIFWDRASQVGGSAHVLSSSVRSLLRLSILWMLRGWGCTRDGTERNAESEEAFRKLEAFRPHLFIFAFQNYISKYTQHCATGGSWSIPPSQPYWRASFSSFHTVFFMKVLWQSLSRHNFLMTDIGRVWYCDDE